MSFFIKILQERGGGKMRVGCPGERLRFWAEISPVGGGAAVYETREAVTLHATGRVDGVTKQTISRHLVTNYTGHLQASVHAHAELR